ncbi:hypothetical protein DAPPUDRAFT_113544 [Daphnia pulex]|uniref:FLYWCH-type domain-containing protein n=1 Tax=Daphnia pulex TaxID=6669 RepID=E9HFA9_DAPPU|nr:hypothetical protein DAPPUDRAFT_113544 [Daphnia pulex]|eukprot:EFX69590.1 hypothetical protein DAPPUDRAFT_113544 [Daphnia pulex]
MPVVIEEHSLVPTPDTDGPLPSGQTSINGRAETESSVEDNESCEYEEEKQVEEEDEDEENETKEQDEENETKVENDGSESEEADDRSESEEADDGRESEEAGEGSESEEEETRGRKRHRSANSSTTSNSSRTKEDLFLGSETLDVVSVSPRHERGGKQARKRRHRARPRRWKIAYKSGKKLSTLLIDRKDGRKFGIWKILKDDSILYRCNYRQKTISCKCTIVVAGNSVKQRGQHLPSCPKEPNLYEKIEIYRDAKKSGLKSKGLSGRVIAQSLTDAHFKANKKMKMVNDENLIKATNRARSKERPPNPKD